MKTGLGHISDFLVTAWALPVCIIAALGFTSVAISAETIRHGGCVTDSEGHPIAGAVVEVYEYPEGRNATPQLMTNVTTGIDGRFELTRRKGYSQLLVRKPGFAPMWRQLHPNQTNAPITLSAPTTLAGTVVDENGKPISNAEVYVSQAQAGQKTDWTTFLGGNLARQLFSARTDAGGHFQIEDFPTNATAELGVRAPGRVLPPRRVQSSADSLAWHGGQQDIRLAVEPAAEIDGRIETETGEQVTNAWVELRSVGRVLGAPWDTTKTVTNRAFGFSGVAAGAYQLFAFFGTNEPPDWVADPVTVDIHAGQSVGGVEIKAAKGGILRVKSAERFTGKPIKDVYLTVHTGSDYLHLRSDSNGLAFFRLLPRRYDVHGMTENSLHGYAPAEVQAGQTNEVTLEFSPPPLVSGLVRDATGKPAAGLDVWSHPGPLRKTQIKTDANGRYQLLHSENPQVVLVVDSAHNMAVSREIEEGVTNLDLQLAPAMTIRGSVRDSRGSPIPKAEAHVYLKSGQWGFPVYWQPVTADALGRFTITNLPADRNYYVNFGARGYGSFQQKVPLDEGCEIELPPIVLKKADLKLVGKVVDSSDTPLANASINVNGFGQPDIDTHTDAQGRFALEVCEGTVYFSVRFQELQTSIQARAGETNVVVVLKPSQPSEPEKPKRASLVGKVLSDLSTASLSGDAIPRGKPVLLCLFDCEQRPSRQGLQRLTEQNEILHQKGVAVVCVQAAVVANDSFDDWKQGNPLPFKIGRITTKTAASAWATETDSLPWLILVNAEGRVTAEGFPLAELTGKLVQLGK